MADDNPIIKHLTLEQRRQMYKKCCDSDEYFWNNYIKKIPGNENLPEYSKEVFEEWQSEAKRIKSKYFR